MEAFKNSTYIIICAWLQTEIEDLNGNSAPSGLIVANESTLKIIASNKRSGHSKPIFKLTAIMLKNGLTDNEWSAVIFKIQTHLNKHPLCRIEFDLLKSKETSL